MKSNPPTTETSELGKFWQAWFMAVGEHATLSVVNATTHLVIAEREIAVRDAIRASSQPQTEIEAFHRGVDAAKQAIRDEPIRDRFHHTKAIFINAIARKCGTDHGAAEIRRQALFDAACVLCSFCGEEGWEPATYIPEAHGWKHHNPHNETPWVVCQAALVIALIDAIDVRVPASSTPVPESIKSMDAGGASWIIERAASSAPAQPTPQGKCVKCGCSNGTDENGWCMTGRPYIANESDSNKRSICACRCEFAPQATAPKASAAAQIATLKAENEQQREAYSIIQEAANALGREVEALRIERVVVLETALRMIANQKRVDAMSDSERANADFEGGYDILVSAARAALGESK